MEEMRELEAGHTVENSDVTEDDKPNNASKSSGDPRGNNSLGTVDDSESSDGTDDEVKSALSYLASYQGASIRIAKDYS